MPSPVVLRWITAVAALVVAVSMLIDGSTVLGVLVLILAAFTAYDARRLQRDRG